MKIDLNCDAGEFSSAHAQEPDLALLAEVDRVLGMSKAA